MMTTIPIDRKGLRPPRRRGQQRLWCVPEALLRDPDSSPIDGAVILQEIRGDRGLLLWQSARDVLLWTDTDPNDRHELFAPDAIIQRQYLLQVAQMPCDAGAAVRTIAQLLRGHPARDGDARLVKRACHQIARWAETEGASRTAITFAQAAAAACPKEAKAALRVGHLSARVGHHALTESWLWRAVALARREGDWSTYGNAYLDLAHLAERRNERRKVRSRFTRALRVGKRYGHSAMRALAYHGLFRLASAEFEFADADRYARAALRFFGKEHPLRPTILHEYADLLLKQATAGALTPIEAGHLAVDVLASVIPDRATESERIDSLLLLVRAASYAKQRVVMENAWFDAVTAIESLGESPEAGHHLLELARATAEILEERRADELAQRALTLAMRTRDRALSAEVNSFLARPRLRAVAS